MEVAKNIFLLCNSEHISLVSRYFSHNDHTNFWNYATRRNIAFGIHSINAQSPEFGEDKRAVVIIAKTADGDYILNKEFRVPLVGKRPSGKCWEISFPAGMIDDGESVENAAKRELAEETPYEITEILSVSPPVASSAGITDELVYIVRCTANLKADQSTAKEPDEDIETILATDSNDPRIPKHDDIVWSARTWLVLSKE